MRPLPWPPHCVCSSVWTAKEAITQSVTLQSGDSQRKVISFGQSLTIGGEIANEISTRFALARQPRLHYSGFIHLCHRINDFHEKSASAQHSSQWIVFFNPLKMKPCTLSYDTSLDCSPVTSTSVAVMPASQFLSHLRSAKYFIHQIQYPCCHFPVL